MIATPDRQISLTDPDARSMATSGRGSGMVGYNVQAAVDTKHHLIVAHEVTNVGTDRAQLSHMAKQTKAALAADTLDVVADRGYFNSAQILACDEAGITVTLPKPLTSNNKAKGRFVKQDFRYVKEKDAYICPAGERLVHHFTNEEKGLTLRRYWTTACQGCAIKDRCTTGKERRITRGRPKAARRASGENAPAARNRRASLWHHQALDGINALPDEDAETGRHRNCLARAGLQSQTRHEHHGHQPPDRSNERSIGARRLQFAPVSGQIATHKGKTRPTRPREPNKSTKPENPSRQIIQIHRPVTKKSARVFTRPGPKKDSDAIALCHGRASGIRRRSRDLSLPPCPPCPTSPNCPAMLRSARPESAR